MLGYSSRDLDVMSMRELTNAAKGHRRAKREDWIVQRRLAYVMAVPHFKKNSLKEKHILPDEFLYDKKKPVKLARVERIGNTKRED